MGARDNPTVANFATVGFKWAGQIGGTLGRPRNHTTKLHADAGYECNATRELLMVIGIEPVIRRPLIQLMARSTTICFLPNWLPCRPLQ